MHFSQLRPAPFTMKRKMHQLCRRQSSTLPNESLCLAYRIQSVPITECSTWLGPNHPDRRKNRKFKREQSCRLFAAKTPQLYNARNPYQHFPELPLEVYRSHPAHCWIVFKFFVYYVNHIANHYHRFGSKPIQNRPTSRLRPSQWQYLWHFLCRSGLRIIHGIVRQWLCVKIPLIALPSPGGRWRGSSDDAYRREAPIGGVVSL
jgi:hypothetical protein